MTKNYTTPRTERDGTWSSLGDPIERPVPRMSWQDRLIIWACMLAAVGLLVICNWGL